MTWSDLDDTENDLDYCNLIFDKMTPNWYLDDLKWLFKTTKNGLKYSIVMNNRPTTGNNTTIEDDPKWIAIPGGEGGT